MPSPINIKCMSCSNYLEVENTNPDSSPPGFVFTCLAFPKKSKADSIPDEIIDWENPHTSVRKDQAGDFVFEEVK